MIELLVGLMKRIELNKAKSGAEKKEWVLRSMAQYKKLTEKEIQILGEVIDWLILFDKNKDKIANTMNICCGFSI
jgi:FixJ family two-component response regulator